MAVLADSGRVFAPGERIGAITLVTEGAALIRARWAASAALWLTLAGASYGIYVAGEAAGLLAAPLMSLEGVAYNAVSAAIEGVAAAAAVGLFVADGRGGARTFRGFAECAGVFAAISFAFLAVSQVHSELQPWIDDPGAAGAVVVGLGLAFAGWFYLTAKIQLWPVARLAGREDVTPRRSWRLMRRATLGYLLASGLLLVVVMIALAAVLAPSWQVEADAGLLGVALTQVGGAAYSVASAALLAAVYRLRVEAPASVADVFA